MPAKLSELMFAALPHALDALHRVLDGKEMVIKECSLNDNPAWIAREFQTDVTPDAVLHHVVAVISYELTGDDALHTASIAVPVWKSEHFGCVVGIKPRTFYVDRKALSQQALERLFPST